MLAHFAVHLDSRLDQRGVCGLCRLRPPSFALLSLCGRSQPVRGSSSGLDGSINLAAAEVTPCSNFTKVRSPADPSGTEPFSRFATEGVSCTHVRATWFGHTEMCAQRPVGGRWRRTHTRIEVGVVQLKSARSVMSSWHVGNPRLPAQPRWRTDELVRTPFRFHETAKKQHLHWPVCLEAE